MCTIKTFGDVDARSFEQLKRCMAAGDADFGVLCADADLAYGAAAANRAGARTASPARPCAPVAPVASAPAIA